MILRGAPLADAVWLEERCIAFRSGGPVAYVLEEAYPEGTSRVEERALVLAPGAYNGGRVVRAGLAGGGSSRLVGRLAGAGGTHLAGSSRGPAGAGHGRGAGGLR